MQITKWSHHHPILVVIEIYNAGHRKRLTEYPSMLPIKTFVLALCLTFNSAAGVVAQADEPSHEESCSMMKPLKRNTIASWYGGRFHGRRTANGEVFDMNAMTAAHKELKMDTMVRVFNHSNGKSAVVRINDRGPFHEGRDIDLSRGAAKVLDIEGVAKVGLYICT